MSRFGLAQLRMRTKFALIAVLALAMSAVPTTMAVEAELETRAVLHAEQAGLAPAGRLLQVVRLTQQHRGLSAAMLGGSATADTARAAKAVELERALAALDSRPGDAIDRLRRDWQSLAAAVAQRSVPAPESFSRHTALVNAELSAIEDILQSSGLALDSESGSYNLIQAVLMQLPELTEWLGQARARGAAALARGEMTDSDRLRLAALMENARNTSAHAQKLLALAMRDEPQLADAVGRDAKAAESAVAEAIAAVNTGFLKAAKAEGDSAAYFATMTRHIDAQFALIDRAFLALESLFDQRLQRAQRHMLLVLGTLLVVGGLALAVLVAVARNINGSIEQAVRATERVAAGELQLALDTRARDETGDLMRALQSMCAALSQVVNQVRSNAESVASASAQIAQGNSDLSQRTERQSSALQQTASSMEELGATVRQNADHTRQANELAASAREVAQRGGAVVGEVVATMEGISGSSRRIADITGVIDGIAFQTNILALNAAVEAARAGEQGRGFAVVAGEVRLLAQRSAAAAKEISGLINASVEQVARGSELVARAGTTMDEVVAAVQRVSGLVGEISTATDQQHAGMAQVSQAVDHIDEATQQNAALVEESAAAAASLREQAQRLVEAVAVFRHAGT